MPGVQVDLLGTEHQHRLSLCGASAYGDVSEGACGPVPDHLAFEERCLAEEVGRRPVHRLAVDRRRFPHLCQAPVADDRHLVRERQGLPWSWVTRTVVTPAR